jgi:hypothetical protein
VSRAGCTSGRGARARPGPMSTSWRVTPQRIRVVSDAAEGVVRMRARAEAGAGQPSACSVTTLRRGQRGARDVWLQRVWSVASTWWPAWGCWASMLRVGMHPSQPCPCAFGPERVTASPIPAEAFTNPL